MYIVQFQVWNKIIKCSTIVSNNLVVLKLKDSEGE